ncbi:hypothetical protein ACWENQ_40950 [Nonomuraea sp. NPDC004354]
MTTPALDAPTMERLSFIRLLHQQGIEQSRAPRPFSFTCVLTFHDAIELFLILAVEHLGMSVKEKAFVPKYFDGLHPSNNNGQGVELAGRNGVKRLTDRRNAFKHANTWPDAQGIEQSRADTATFFEENTPKVFGIEYAEINMADLVPQESVRDLVKAAAAAESAGERIEAMAFLVDAANAVSHEHVGETFEPSPFSFGPDLSWPMRENEIANVLRSEQDFRGDGSKLAKQITTLTEITLATQRALRVTTLGIDYAAFHKFRILTPIVDHSVNGERSIHHPFDYAPTAEHYAYCLHVVITMALRLADIQSHLSAPS